MEQDLQFTQIVEQEKKYLGEYELINIGDIDSRGIPASQILLSGDFYDKINHQLHVFSMNELNKERVYGIRKSDNPLTSLYQILDTSVAIMRGVEKVEIRIFNRNPEKRKETIKLPEEILS